MDRYIRSVAMAFMWPIECDWMALATLPGSTESYSEHTRTFENHANLLAYLANRPLFTLENGFQGTIKCQGSPFLGFAQVFSIYCFKKLPEWTPTKHSYVRGHIDDPPLLN